MGKLTAVETYAAFETLWEGSKISDTSLTFILDTGQLYTHGFFLNSVSYGTEASGYVPIRVAGVTKNISLQGHTHSGYYSNSADIDIGSNKIVSGQSDLLKLDSGNIIIGNSDNPTYLYGTLTTTRNDNNYTILDTGNFSITQTTSNNLALSNVATFKYGNKSFQLDYVKRVEVISTFDLQNSYTNFGTISEASKWYGFMTMYTDSNTTNPKYAQIRIGITSNKLEYRTSSHTTWTGVLEGGSYINLPINGTNYQVVTKAATLPNIWAPSSLGNARQVLSVSNDGQSLAWRDITNLTASNKGVKIANDVITLDLNSDTLNDAEIGGKLYAVELDKNGKLAVNVPWVSTTTMNSKVDDGYVLKGQNHPNKVWMTNDQGDPDWRDLDITSTLTAATVNSLGLVKVYDTVNVPFTAEPTNAPVDGRYYGVQIDGGNKLFVNIPWINTWNPYTAPTESAAGTAGYITPPTYQDIDKFLKGDGTWDTPANSQYYITLNGTVNGTASSTNLGTIFAPTVSGTGFLKCSVANDVVTWSYDNTTYATPDTTYNITVNISYSGGWADTGIQSNTLVTGTYAVQVYMSYSDLNMYYSYWSGIMSWYADSTNQNQGEEILLHCASHYTGNDIYLRTLRTTSGVLKLQLACDTSFSSKDIQFKFRKLI